MNQRIKLNQIEIEALRTSWMGGTTSLFSGFKGESEIYSYLNELRNHRVIEIGPGGNPVNLSFNCKEYMGVQPHKCFVPNIGGENYIIEDGLTFLRKKPSSSAVIVSFAVIDEDVLGYGNAWSLNDNQIQYIKELADEIKRVSSPYAIVLGSDAEKYLGKANLIDIDFTRMGGVYSFDN